MKKCFILLTIMLSISVSHAWMEKSGMLLATCKVKNFLQEPTDMDIYIGRRAGEGFVYLDLLSPTDDIDESGKYIEIISVVAHEKSYAVSGIGEGGQISFTLPKVDEAKEVEIEFADEKSKCLVRGGADKLF